MDDAILVTGATGFIGRHLVPYLVAKGYRVLSYSRVNGDISRTRVDCQCVRHVFHLAGKTFVPQSWQSPFDFYATNVLGTVNVLDFCRRERASMTLISSYVYGVPVQLPIREDHPVTAWNPYSHTKVLAENTAEFYAQKFDVGVTIIRPFNIYGPGQDSRFLIPTLIAKALDPMTSEIRVADDRPKRDYLHVSDLVVLMTLALEKGARGIYNAGSGRSTSIPELVAIINRSTGIEKPLRSEGKKRESEVLETVADISKAREELGWSPQISLEEGIKGVLASAMARQGQA